MTRQDVYWIVGLTVLFEAVTCLFRFGLGLQSTRDTGFVKSLTGGIRIHHGYVGVLMIGAGFLVPQDWALRPWLFRVGGALAASDLVHHFLVLWPVTGDPQFDLTYPD